MKNFNNRDSNAFTLVEMLVVLGMISILMGVTFTGIGKARTQAKVAKANSEVRTLMNAWLAYEASYDDWPVAITGTDIDAVESNIKELLGENGSPVFLNAQLSGNPLAFRDPWGNPYQFRLLSDSGGENKVTDAFGSAITFPNRQRLIVTP
ncbi:MAG: prepilin-type N-terminal cleavage/methylation domain-containing protein [Kiritimatiellae bacterium]|jgi:prepilin-type N-terminal cleavage/methylation domain-containing protein|nr:prepilin-type N-terminal cleavage/methylation domain-containing protein [Kiritimatiellia bacterium]